MALTTSETGTPLRNPGPSWGYDFLRRSDRWIPRPVFRALLGIGAGVAVALMPGQRRHSRAYLSAALGRKPSLLHVWRHFFTYAQAMMDRIRAAEHGGHRCTPQAGFEPFRELMQSQRPALLGTFHFGHSDLLGFMLGDLRRHVHMIRLRVENSRDTHHLSARFGEWVTYLWVNQPEQLLFTLKQALQSGGTIAMMCDRIEHSSKLEPFQFLGARRLMPFTIYHLALVFRLPVAFCLSIPGGRAESLLYASPIFEPDASGRERNLQRARAHFQAVLAQVESLLQRDPYQWFNFLPLSPPLPDPAAAAPAQRSSAAITC